jgi:hypothetical protein
VLQVPSDAEITQLHLSLCSEEYVLCLQVAVDDFAIVYVLDCEASLSEPLQNLLLRQKCFCLSGLSDALAEVSTLGIGHHDVQFSLALE